MCFVTFLDCNFYFIFLQEKPSQAKKYSFYSPDKLGNFEPPAEEPRSGPGEGGKAHILPADQRNEASQSISEFGMNMVCSDEISLSRSIFDTRVKE